MKNHFLLSAAASAILASQSFAGTMGPVPPQDWSWVGSIAAGPIWANAGRTQTFFLAPEIEKSYVARKSTNTFVSGELFAGIQKSMSSEWLGQLGLAVATTGNAELQGLIWDDADPLFDNHSYQYKVRNTRVAIKSKLLFDNHFLLMPWVSASLGVSFNRSHSFGNTPLIFEALPNPNFADHTKTAFSYTLGIGVQKAVNEHWQLGVGYEFGDWGKSKLGCAVGQIMDTRLALNHLYTNGLLFNFSYTT